MPLDTFVAGAYTTTYNAVGVGITTEGFELQQDSKAEVIEESDAYGQMLIDWVYRGGQVFLQYEAMAYKAGSLTPWWPYGAFGTAGVIGRLASNIAVSTQLTATAGTPAAAAPNTLTGAFSLLAPNNPLRTSFNSKLRKLPTRLSLMAYDSGGGVIKWFV